MSLNARYRDGLFRLVGKGEGLTPGRIHRVLSEDELRALRELQQSQRKREKSVGSRDNDNEASYGWE